MNDCAYRLIVDTEIGVVDTGIGQKPCIVDAKSGAVIEVELFVGVLGASNYTFSEATRTQRIEDWLGSHVRMVEYFGGVSTMVVPDQLKSAVTNPCRYEPGITRSYAQWAQHYGTAIVPARVFPARKAARLNPIAALRYQ